jgi:hypothetical protein
MAGVRKALIRVVTVVGAIGPLLLIFRVVPFAEVMRSIRSAEPTKLAIGFALLFLGRLLAAWSGGTSSPNRVTRSAPSPR